jgi:hypothetical protein
MSMIGHLRAVTPAELARLQEHPASIREFLKSPKKDLNAVKAKNALLRAQRVAMEAQAAAKSGGLSPEEKAQLRDQIIQAIESSGAFPALQGLSERGLTLEKSWHTLHYLLTGSSREAKTTLGMTIRGREFGPDVGYGPARYLDPADVAKVAQALAKVSNDDLARRFDLQAMIAARVYACGDESELKLAQRYFAMVVRYYTEAAARGDAMILFID